MHALPSWLPPGPLVCQVEGCGAALDNLKEYHQRYKVACFACCAVLCCACCAAAPRRPGRTCRSPDLAAVACPALRLPQVRANGRGMAQHRVCRGSIAHSPAVFVQVCEEHLKIPFIIRDGMQVRHDCARLPAHRLPAD